LLPAHIKPVRKREKKYNITTTATMQTSDTPNTWKDVTVSYKYKGEQVTEKFYLTVDLDGNQVVVLSTAGVILASQPGETCNRIKLREDAIASFLAMGQKAF
jgi:hypothetical protein